jgi:Domain of unknown function (DUF6285)
MNDRPTPLELIRIANDALASSVMPDAKAEHLYTLRMIANALGIAARELATHDANATAETQRLNALYAPCDTPPADNADGASLHQRNQRLAQDIRHGMFESSSTQQAALRRHLMATAQAKLAAAYPKGLTASSSDTNINKNK